jgi:hypothetical protein
MAAVYSMITGWQSVGILKAPVAGSTSLQKQFGVTSSQCKSEGIKRQPLNMYCNKQQRFIS